MFKTRRVQAKTSKRKQNHFFSEPLRKIFDTLQFIINLLICFKIPRNIWYELISKGTASSHTKQQQQQWHVWLSVSSTAKYLRIYSKGTVSIYLKPNNKEKSCFLTNDTEELQFFSNQNCFCSSLIKLCTAMFKN